MFYGLRIIPYIYGRPLKCQNESNSSAFRGDWQKGGDSGRCFLFLRFHKPSVVAWPSGLRRWIKAPVSSGAWVRIPPLPDLFFVFF